MTPAAQAGNGVPVPFTQNKVHVIAKNRKLGNPPPKKDTGHSLPNYKEWRLTPVTENSGLLELRIVRQLHFYLDKVPCLT